MKTSACVRMIRDNPSFSRQTPEWLAGAAWCFGYAEEPVPDRHMIAKALASCGGLRTAPPRVIERAVNDEKGAP